ncbi:MAG: PD40 domain-containing protein [Bacteroidales bacterium]|nr:PD40 domain-containing protein [Bacteroidales bacterium]
MRKILILFIVIGFETNSCAQNKSLLSDYLNQPAPSDIPVIFAPGLISIENANEYPCSFSNDFSFMLFGYNWGGGKKDIMVVNRAVDGKWLMPRKISFTGFPESEAILSPDNNKIFFAAHSDSTKYKAHDLWYVEKKPGGWGNPMKLIQEINSEEYEYFATLTNKNKIYFTREGKGQILSADYLNNNYVNIQPIDSIINGMKFVGHPYISPDESYLIFDSREFGGFGSADLYISFKTNDKWGNPINLGNKINTSDWDAMPIVSPDGQYLFFCREINMIRDIYWVKFDINKYNTIK